MAGKINCKLPSPKPKVKKLEHNASCININIYAHHSSSQTMASDPNPFELHTTLSHLFLLLSIPTYLLTRYIIVAPFGRHVPKQNHWWFGPKFDARWSWFLFECPNLIWACYYYSSMPYPQSSIGSGSYTISTNMVLMSLFTLHYINRDIIYPLRMNPISQKVPLVVIIAAGFITTWNGYLQCFYLAHIRQDSSLSIASSSLENIQTWVGIGFFFLGMGINLHSDGVLRNLRRNNSTTAKPIISQQQNQRNGTRLQHHDHHAYYIPHSPWFTYISCPNFFGELVEWFGFAMASHFSLPSVAFLIYTASNLIPRGIAHHHWYQQKFEDYPSERKWAVIPLIV